VDRAFIVLPSLAILLIHKCGSSSINAAALTLGIEPRVYPVEMMATYPTRAVMIREPHARLESAWAVFHRDGVISADFAAWVVDVCEGRFDDMHVTPAATFLAGFNPTEIVRWDFARMAELIGAPIPHANANTPRHACHWTPAASEVFARTYAADLALWSSVAQR
jgi:hypothetical protein